MNRRAAMTAMMAVALTLESLASAETEDVALLPPVPIMVATVAEKPPLIDGKVDVGEWDLAAPGGLFVPLRADAPPDNVEARAFWSNQFLYLLIRGTAPVGLPRDEFSKDRFAGGEPDSPLKTLDLIDVYLDPRPAFASFDHPADDPGHFQITILIQNGTRRQGSAGPPYWYTAARERSRSGFRDARRVAWEPEGALVSCQMGSQGFVCELAIPFGAFAPGRWQPVGHSLPGEPPLMLGAPPQPGDRWALQVARRHPNGAAWAWCARGTMQRPVRTTPLRRPFGLLVFDAVEDAQALPELPTPAPTQPPPPGLAPADPVRVAIDGLAPTHQTDGRPVFFSTFTLAARAARAERKPLLLVVVNEATALRLTAADYWKHPELDAALRRIVAVRLDPNNLPPGLPLPAGPGRQGLVLLTWRGNVAMRYQHAPEPGVLALAIRQVLGEPSP